MADRRDPFQVYRGGQAGDQVPALARSPLVQSDPAGDLGLGDLARGLSATVGELRRGHAEREQQERELEREWLKEFALGGDEAGDEIYTDSQKDPAGFKARYTARMAKLAEGAPTERAARLAALEARRIGRGYMRTIQSAVENDRREMAEFRTRLFAERQSATLRDLIEAGRYEVGDDGALGGEAGVIYARLQEHITDAIENDTMTPAGAAAHILALERTAREGLALHKFEAARRRGLGVAERFIDEVERGGHGMGDPGERRAVLADMNRRLGAQRVAANRARGNLAREAGLAARVVASGETYNGLDDLRRRLRLAGMTDAADGLDATITMADGLESFRGQDIATMREQVARHAEAGVSDAADLDRLKAERQILEATEKARHADPLTLAETRGVMNVEPIDLSSGDALAASLQRRRRQAQEAADYYETRPVLLRKGEAERLKDLLANTKSAGQKAALLGGFHEGLVAGGDTAPFLAFLDEIKATDPVFAHAGALVAGGRGGTAEMILRGAEIMASEPQYAPKSKPEFAAALTDALPNSVLPMAPESRAGLDDAIKADYVARSRDADDASREVHPDRLAASVAAVTGGLVSYDPGVLSDEWETVAPIPGMGAEAFGDLMDGLTDADVAGAYDGNGRAITAEQLRDGFRFVSLGGGKYAAAGANTGHRVVGEDGASTWVIDLGALARAKGIAR